MIRECTGRQHFIPGETYSQESPDKADENGAENDKEKAESCTFATSGLSIYCCKWECTIAGENCIKVTNTVKYGDGEEESRESTEPDLQKNGLWQIPLWFWHLFGQVRNSIGRTNGESAVKNTSQEGDAAWPARGVFPILPDERRSSMLLWHAGNNDYGDQASTKNKEEAQILELWDQPVEENAEG